LRKLCCPLHAKLDHILTTGDERRPDAAPMAGREKLLALRRYVHAGQQRAKSFASRIEISIPDKLPFI
jgi:hypothetical protein